jgi:hypothetical protein
LDGEQCNRPGDESSIAFFWFLPFLPFAGRRMILAGAMKMGGFRRCGSTFAAWVGVASICLAAGDLRLIQAVRSQDPGAIEALLKQGVDVNATQPDGATALHWAAYHDDQRTTDRLIRAGAQVNARNELGATPLWLAAVHGGAAVIERLLAAGADANVALPSGETPLMTAARAGDVQATTLLITHGADGNATEFA